MAIDLGPEDSNPRKADALEFIPAHASMLRQSLHQLSLHIRGEGFIAISTVLDWEIGASGLATGLANLACLHTSCSLNINVNSDP